MLTGLQRQEQFAFREATRAHEYRRPRPTAQAHNHHDDHHGEQASQQQDNGQMDGSNQPVSIISKAITFTIALFICHLCIVISWWLFLATGDVDHHIISPEARQDGLRRFVTTMYIMVAPFFTLWGWYSVVFEDPTERAGFLACAILCAMISQIMLESMRRRH